MKKPKVIILYLKIMGISSLTHSCLFKHKSKVFESKSSRMQTKTDLDYTNDNLGKLFLKTVNLVSNDATFKETAFAAYNDDKKALVAFGEWDLRVNAMSNLMRPLKPSQKNPVGRHSFLF
jgi:hypothetical protein